jgi:2,3-bisphosphoglycerate-independent phosphoglycerate mutase
MTAWQLAKHSTFAGVSGPVLVVVMDGVGYGHNNESDAVWLARKPHLDLLHRSCPHTRLRAHGIAVGMPSDDDMGNSEVGHNALGAGRIFDQGAKLVQHAIDTGSLYEGDTWKAVTQRARERNTPVHFVGLLSDGNVHSHIAHLIALVERCSVENVKTVRIHVLLDGRDVPETSGLIYVERLEQALAKLNERGDRDYRIASGGGRMVITMDRYNANWPMVEAGYKTHVLGEGRQFKSTTEAIETYRSEQPGLSDQNLPPFVIAGPDGKPLGPIDDGSSVVLFNFRGDRAIEFSLAMEDEAFAHFKIAHRPDVLFAGMMQYDGDLMLPRRFLVSPPSIDYTLGEYLARNGLAQYASSETQKFGHVTYFWNGNRSGKFDDQNETYVEIPSDLRPFEERPWMKAAEITDKLVEALVSEKYKHLRVNYANGDMVGHTGFRDPAVQAVEAVDVSIGRILPIIQKLKGALIVTADHGNADEMYQVDKKGKISLDKSGYPIVKTSHTLNEVPFLVYAPGYKLAIDDKVDTPGLSNIAASVLNLLGFQAPDDFRPSLIRGA